MAGGLLLLLSGIAVPRLGPQARDRLIGFGAVLSAAGLAVLPWSVFLNHQAQIAEPADMMISGQADLGRRFLDDALGDSRTSALLAIGWTALAALHLAGFLSARRAAPKRRALA